MPLLEQYGASKADICTQCQEPIAEEDAHWVLRDGAVAFRMHHTCAEELKDSISATTKNPRISQEGALSKGILGALLGAVLGAVLWMAMELIRFYAPIAGMAIGWLVVNCYSKFGGKTGKFRLPILIITGIFGTALGVFLASFATTSDKSAFFSILADSQILSSMIELIGLGLLFFALGLFVALKGEKRRTSDYVVTDLN